MTPRRLTEIWRDVRREAPSTGRALRWVLEYCALRTWALLIGCFPIEANLRTAGWLGNVWWLLMKRHRDRAMDNLRPALGDVYDDRTLRRIARRSFEHFARLYLVEMIQTPRLITAWSWSRYVSLGDIGPALRELLSDRGALMVTPHFGNYELMGFTISRLGLPHTAIMRPLDNPLLNRYLVESRRSGGISLVFKKGAAEAVGPLLRSGEAVGFIADQDAGRKGVFVDFFGRPASWYKSIGLLAMRFNVPVIVAHAHRERRGFHYRIEVDRIIDPQEWESRVDALRWITTEFAGAMEAAIRQHPEQYLWVHKRWKSQPRGGPGGPGVPPGTEA